MIFAYCFIYSICTSTAGIWMCCLRCIVRFTQISLGCSTLVEKVLLTTLTEI